MFRGPRAAVAASFAIAATAAVTAGCGGSMTGSSGSALALDPAAAAATKTQDSGAARVRFALTLGSPQLHGRTVRLRGTGAIDDKSAELSFKLGSLLRLARSSGGIAPDLALPSGTNASLKEILLEQHGDYVVYVHLGLLTAELPGGKQWVKLDVSKLGKSAGLDLDKQLSGSQLQPTDLLSLLESDGAKVRTLGLANVDGTATTHYRVTVDVGKALKAKGLTSPLFAGVAAKLTLLPADVWIGKDGLVRRIRISAGAPQSGKQGHVGVTMDLFDYGAHVAIAAPASSSVFDATQLAESGIGSGLFH